MTEEMAKKIFEQYNRSTDVVRCPNGRAIVRKQLDSYAKAVVNLYGMISREDFVEIFNKQNSDQTNSEEVYILLLPLVLKEGWYGFYKEYIVHYSMFNDFGFADYLLKHQADKPRYIPEKSELLKYTAEEYLDNDHVWDVRLYMLDVFGYGKHTLESFEEVRDFIAYGEGISELSSILDHHHLIFRDEKQLRRFIDLVMLAKNSMRIWENKGYSPSELSAIMRERDKNISKFPIVQKANVGRNDPCPCGSGKKYKKCCALFDDRKSAQLSSVECRLFYETWYGLMGFVNEQKHVIKATIRPEYPNPVSDMMIHKVREVLWENPELIDDYLSETKLPQEKIEILKKWRTKHKKGMFFILEYQPEYAIAIAPNAQGEDRLYGIKGISNSMANVLRRELPVQIETVLLPFKGKIIYDSFMGSVPVGFLSGAKAAFREMYDGAIKHGIVISLDEP